MKSKYKIMYVSVNGLIINLHVDSKFFSDLSVLFIQTMQTGIYLL